MVAAGRPSEKPDYGIDAPAVVRNLIIAAVVGLALWAPRALGLWPGRFDLNLGGAGVVIEVAGVGLVVGAICAVMAGWMLWDSRVGKIRRREQLLDEIAWTGGERVLDVGCGRGLMMIGAARRLTTGKATGVDLWQAEDLSGNRPEAALENARREGVSERVEVRTGDMRKLPFEDAAFDVVVSRAAIHNLQERTDRVQAFGEIARVLRPGGQLLIEDIRHPREYLAALAGKGFADVRRVDSRIASGLARLLSFGSLDPVTVSARKA